LDCRDPFCRSSPEVVDFQPGGRAGSTDTHPARAQITRAPDQLRVAERR
jgi:hypothetical protein